MITYPSVPGLWAFPYMFKNILFRYHGSVVPSIMPQIVAAVLLTFLYDQLEFTLASKPFGIVAFPLAFLLAYKSRSAYGQYWEGRTHAESFNSECRSVVLQVVSYMHPTKGKENDPQELLELALEQDNIVRWLKLFNFLVIENLQQSSSEEHEDSGELLDRLKRFYSRLIVFESEKAALEKYNGVSAFKRGKPLMVLMWVHKALTNATDRGRLHRLQFHCIDRNLNDLMKAFNGMSKIAQMLFPFPLAQLILIYEIVLCAMLPAVLLNTLGEYSYVLAPLIVLAYFGIESVGTSLESPYGFEENDLDLVKYTFATVRELDVLLLSRRFRLCKSLRHARALAKQKGEDDPEVRELHLALTRAWGTSVQHAVEKLDMDILRDFSFLEDEDVQCLAKCGISFDDVLQEERIAQKCIKHPVHRKDMDKEFYRKQSFLPKRLSLRSISLSSLRKAHPHASRTSQPAEQ